MLFKEVSEGNVSLIVLSLLHIGQLIECLQDLFGAVSAGPVRIRWRTWCAIRLALVFDTQRFSDDDLTKLAAICARDGKWLSKPDTLLGTLLSPPKEPHH